MKKLICIKKFVDGIDVGYVLESKETDNYYLIGMYDFISGEIKTSDISYAGWYISGNHLNNFVDVKKFERDNKIDNILYA